MMIVNLSRIKLKLEELLDTQIISPISLKILESCKRLINKPKMLHFKVIKQTL